MFERDLIYGECGEERCWIELLNSPYTKYVMDVRDDKYFQAIDIDFLQRRNNSVAKIEVKSDRKAHITGNFVYETKSNSNEGCLARSEADYVYYYLPETDIAYFVNLKSLKRYLENNNFKEVEMGDGAKGYLIPFKILEEEKIIIKKSEKRNWSEK